MELLSNPILLLLAAGIVLIIVIKIIRSIVAKVVGIVFTGFAMIRFYMFMNDKF